MTSMELQDKQLKECRNEINELKNAITGLNSAQSDTFHLSVEVGQKTQMSLAEISRQLEELSQNQVLSFQSASSLGHSRLTAMELARLRCIPPAVPGAKRRSEESLQSRDSSDYGPPDRWVDDPPYLNHR